MTDEAVEALPSTEPPAPSASDASFWDSTSYRSGGDDWNRFLEIDAPKSDASDAAVGVAGDSLEGLRDDALAGSPMSELANFADYHSAEAVIDEAPTAVVTGFEFLAETSDDLLPDR